MIRAPKPKLQAGVIYAADNGELICLKCAGMTAKLTGKDRSGKRVQALNQADALEWERKFSTPLQCEAGCTTFQRDDAKP